MFLLLSGSELVQDATVAGLFERLYGAVLSAETMTLLPMIRGWFASDRARAGLNELIRKARRKAIPGQSSVSGSQIQEIVASNTDGVGAQSVPVVLKQGATTVLAMVLIKAGHVNQTGFTGEHKTWKVDGVDAPSHNGIVMCQTGFVRSQFN